MRFYRFFLFLSVCVTISCSKEGPKLLDINSDLIFAQYKKEISELETDKKKSEAQLGEARERIQDLSANPKLIDIIKTEIFTHERYISQIDQQISFLKIKMNERLELFQNSAKEMTQKRVTQDLADYEMSLKSNPKSYPWRAANFLPIPKGESKDAKEGEKKSDSGHGAPAHH